MTRQPILRILGVSGLAAALVAATLSSVLVPASAHGATDTVVRTNTGLIKGVRAGGVDRFLGVPYAAPPTGRFRWTPPRPAQPWTGVRDATKASPACAQAGGVGQEDCLNLEVTVPHSRGNSGEPGKAAAGRKPVMVWLHGGGMSIGRGSEINPTRMAAQGDVVVVSVDFRLGAMGLFSLPGLPGGGTFTLADQQAALRWVRANISVFGGDPKNVTLFGESGGAVATCGQLTSPGSAGLFQKAIMQSGSCAVSWPKNGLQIGSPAGSFFRPVADIDRAGRAAAKKVGCDRTTTAAQLDCLREVPTDRLTAASEFSSAATGTPLLPVNPATAVSSGLTHRVPVISGSNRHEFRYMVGVWSLLGQKITPAMYPKLIDEAFGKRAGQVKARYPLSRYAGADYAFAAIYTDRMFVCPQVETTKALSRRAEVYGYEFADENAPPYDPISTVIDPGASHAAELMYLFDIAGKPADLEHRPISYTPAQRQLAATMIDYWTQFARTGDPNSSATPTWPRWSASGSGSGLAATLAPAPRGIGTIDVSAEHQCDFWSDE